MELKAKLQSKLPDEEELSKKMFQLGMVPLTLIFLHPTKTKLQYQKIGCMLLSIDSVILTYWALKYLFVYEIELTTLSQIISSCGLYILAQLKIMPLVYFNDTIRSLLDAKKKFWKANDPKLKKTVTDLYALSYLIGKIFTILVIITFLMYIARPLYDKGSLITLQWYEEKYYVHVLCCLASYGSVLVALVLGFNGLFFGFITDMRSQFIILNWTITHRKNDGSENDMKMLIKCVKHHRFLLRCIKNIEKVFMIQLLALYGLTVVSCCMELYALTEAATRVSDKFRSLVYCFTLLVQLAMFCFPASDLTQEIFLVSESLYLSDWENGSRELQTWLPFAIMSTQQVVDFKAMGMVTINKFAFVSVFKTTMSFLTLMRNMK